MNPPVVLASTSSYRRALLARLGIEFTAIDPGIDESRVPDAGTPSDRARARARAKCLAVAGSRPEAVVIGSDQVCAAGGQVFGKPGDLAKALATWAVLRGRAHSLHTALAVAYRGRLVEHLDTTTLHARDLDDDQLRFVLERDRPYDCAGAYKLEESGIALFERIETEDPTAIEGLPLLALGTILRDLGLRVPPRAS